MPSPMSTSALVSKPSTKPSKKRRLITLRLSPAHLSHFPSNSTPKPSPTPPTLELTPSIHAPEPADKSSESTATPVPTNTTTTADGTDTNSLAPPKVDKRKRGGGQVSGRKRAPPSIDPNGPMRERGRPGPKKKPRLPDGTIDRSHDTSKPNPVPAHRLGPKANTGNINANLRALDRKGKPCRKWERKPLQIKSFTGTFWGMRSWKAPRREESFPSDVKSDSRGSSELKPNESSAVPSERSNSNLGHGEPVPMNGIESSPAPTALAA